MVAEVGVDAIGEVDRRRACGQVLNLAVRRVDEHLVLEDISLQRLDEILGVSDVALPLQQPAQPGEPLLEAHVLGRALLVTPVGGDAVLR